MILILLLFLLLVSPAKAQSSKLDVLDFMRPKFDYNEFTENNSYLAINIHLFDKTLGKWTHYTELPTCPAEMESCVSTNWKARNMIRQKPGENILYFNKGFSPVPNRVPETFWFNQDSVYDFGEGYAFDPKDASDPSLFGLFHNFYLPSSDNPNLDFPNRGYIWSKRYFTPGEDTVIPFTNVKIEDFRNMLYQRSWDGSAKGTVKLIYYPSWDSSQFTWNNKPDTGNLPTPLEVIVNEQTNIDTSGNVTFMERYYYARNSTNSFGIIRYESWQPKEQVCGSKDCCTTQTCIGNMAMNNYNTFNNLAHYDPGEDPDQYFVASYYADPKLEVYPDAPSNGALSRGRFQFPGNGQTTDGQQINAGNWVQLTSILTDGDWMISAVIIDRHCPDGYQYLGSIATNFYDHKNLNQGYGWAELCGTNKNVMLAATCPAEYISRGWFDTPTTPISVYDFQGNAVSGKRINYCVLYNEFHYPKKTFLSGDIDGNGLIDLNDLKIIITNWLGNDVCGLFNCDLNNDVKTNVLDAAIVVKNLGL